MCCKVKIHSRFWQKKALSTEIYHQLRESIIGVVVDGVVINADLLVGTLGVLTSM